MIKVKFLQDYRGVLTNEQYYQADETAELDIESMNDLIDRNIVERLSPPIQGIYMLSLDELRKLGKVQGIRGHGRMKRETLLKRLS